MKRKATTVELRRLARDIRMDIIRMSLEGKSSHIGTALSVVDILTVLYFRELRIDSGNPEKSDRDRFILSKGHGGVALYATLAHAGFFKLADVGGYCANGSMLIGHTDKRVPGVEVSTGSLGHGLSVGLGMALALRSDAPSARVFIVLGDGECDEGSVWEAIMAAAHYGLDNVVAIIDYNKIQALGRVDEVMGLEPLAEKFSAFGWIVREIDGHDLETIAETIEAVPFKTGRPSAIIAHTVKGKGVSFMEDTLLWHYKSLSREDADAALAELECSGTE